MYKRSGAAARRFVVVAAVLGLLLTLVGTAEAPAKTAKCKKGFTHKGKSKKCVKIKKVATATTKKVTATTAKPVVSSSLPANADPNGVLRVGLDLSAQGGLKF